MVCTQSLAVFRQNTLFSLINNTINLDYFIDLHNSVKCHNSYNYCGAKILLVHTNLNIPFLEENLAEYHDFELINYLKYGFPLGVVPTCIIKPTLKNHPSAHQYFNHIDDFIVKELNYNGIPGPFTFFPFEEPHISPLMTVPKKPTGRRIVLDASYGDYSLNNAIPESIYLGEPTEYNYPKVEEFEALIIKHGTGALLWKRDLCRFFLQLPVDPSDYDKLCFVCRGFLFISVVAMFGLRNSGYAGQRTTSGVV